jgi:hypothetical protein
MKMSAMCSQRTLFMDDSLGGESGKDAAYSNPSNKSPLYSNYRWAGVFFHACSFSELG